MWFYFSAITYTVMPHLNHLVETILMGFHNVQKNYNGSNTDGSFTTAVSNSFLSPLEKNHLDANLV